MANLNDKFVIIRCVGEFDPRRRTAPAVVAVIARGRCGRGGLATTQSIGDEDFKNLAECAARFHGTVKIETNHGPFS